MRRIEYIVNCRFLTQKFTGVQNYAYSCALNMQSIFRDKVLFVAPPGKLNNKSQNFENLVQVGYFSGHLWEQVSLPYFAYKLGKPLLLSFCGLAPIIYNRAAYCVHDIAIFRHPEFFSLKYRLTYNIATRIVIRRVLSVLSVSDFTKSEIKDFFGIENVTIVSNALAEVPLPKKALCLLALKDKLPNENFILTVGSLDPRKNLDVLFEIFETTSFDDTCLVVVGGHGNAFNKRAVATTKSKNVIFMGYLEDWQLHELYGKAKALIFPSHYEGFGLPPLEAMRNGCPVLASNKASMPEVCDKAALYFDPNEKGEIILQINRILTDPNIVKKMIKDGYQRVSHYSRARQKEQLERAVKISKAKIPS